MAKKAKPLGRDEAIEILEELARSGSVTARISAIKQLESLGHFDDENREEKPQGFDELDELTQKRRSRRRA